MTVLLGVGVLTCIGIAIIVRGWWRETRASMAAVQADAVEMARLAAALAPPPAGPHFSRDWWVRRLKDGSTVIMLAQKVETPVEGQAPRHRAVVTMIHMPPGEDADGAWAAYHAQQSSLVERAFADGARVPAMSEVVPGAPRKAGAA